MDETNKLGRKMKLARKELLRYIFDAQLKVGDKLPSQAALVGSMGLSSSTIIRAVNSLKDEGVLEVRDKVGVFLRDDHLVGKSGRTVALLTQRIEYRVSPYYSELTLLLISRLQAAGCKALLFQRNPLSDEKKFSYRDFPGLDDAVKDGEIDAAYDMTSLSWGGDGYFSRYDIPLVSLGMQPHSANCVIIDMVGFCRDGLETLFDAGARRICVVAPHPSISRLMTPHVESFFAERGLEFRPDFSLITIGKITDGRRVAAEFFQRSDAERPDGFLFLDEFVGLDALNGFAVCRADNAGYHPAAVLGTDPEIQIGYPRDDLFLFTKSIREIASLSVAHILDVARNQAETPIVNYHYRYIGREKFFGEEEGLKFNAMTTEGGQLSHHKDSFMVPFAIQKSNGG